MCFSHLLQLLPSIILLLFHYYLFRSLYSSGAPGSIEYTHPRKILLFLFWIHVLVEKKIDPDKLFLLGCQLLVLYEFHRVDSGIDGLQYFVKIDLSNFPRIFLEGEKINTTIHNPFHIPNFHLLILTRCWHYHRILLDQWYLLNTFLVSFKTSPPFKLIYIYLFNIIVWVTVR